MKKVILFSLLTIFTFTLNAQVQIKTESKYETVMSATKQYGNWSRYEQSNGYASVQALGGNHDGKYLFNIYTTSGSLSLQVITTYREKIGDNYIYDVLGINGQDGYRYSIVKSKLKFSQLASGTGGEIIVEIKEPNTANLYSKFKLTK